MDIPPIPIKQYYYLNEQGQQMPPVDFESLRSAGITADTMVWFEGLPSWTRAGDIAELKPIIGIVPPPVPTQTTKPSQSHRLRLGKSKILLLIGLIISLAGIVYGIVAKHK